MIKVTIVLPLHNSKTYVDECIKSIVNQTLQDIEIICIDSGTDETSNIIQSYAGSDNRVKYIYDSNTSYGYKINKGITLSQGKYIAIIESDDYVRDDTMQILYELAEKNQVDFVKADYKKFIDINGKRVEAGVENIPNQTLYNRVINLKEEPEIRNYIGYSIWAGLYRKEFLISNELFMNETPGASYQDTGFAILITLMTQKLYFTDHQLYRYRIDNNDSSVKSQMKYKCIIEEFCWIKEQMQFRSLNKVEDIAFYKNKKLVSYFWNYQRLLPEYQLKFLNEIQEEMENDFFSESPYMETVSTQQLEEIKILHGDVAAINEFERSRLTAQQNFEQVVAILKNEKEIVIFGAGRYGEVVVKLSNILSKNNVVAICDSDKQKHNKEIAGLKIGDPQETVIKHKNAFYIIANKKHSEEISFQLRKHGILQEKIYAIKEIPGKSALLEAVLMLPEIVGKGV
ncbi:glycosyltransferase [Lacrimispora sp. BS-2]|uniref:Glycosyltransferase n=1 Tax=Lacrimispora sp. BS-2 TaxID=3151850 RepID=A0AAU7PP73_9FIRM